MARYQIRNQKIQGGWLLISDFGVPSSGFCKEIDQEFTKPTKRVRLLVSGLRFLVPHSAFRIPQPLPRLAPCRLFSESHCRGIGIDFFTAAKPTEGAATQIPGSIAIGNLVKMSFWITEYTDHRLGQSQRREQTAWNVFLSFIWQLTKEMIPILHRCPQTVLGMSGKMFAELGLISRYRHLVAARQHSDVFEFFMWAPSIHL